MLPQRRHRLLFSLCVPAFASAPHQIAVPALLTPTARTECSTNAPCTAPRRPNRRSSRSARASRTRPSTMARACAGSATCGAARARSTSAPPGPLPRRFLVPGAEHGAHVHGQRGLAARVVQGRELLAARRRLAQERATVVPPPACHARPIQTPQHYKLGLTKTCAVCAAGSACSGNSIQQCPAGTSSDAGQAACTSCAQGTYQSDIGVSACVACPAGPSASWCRRSPG